MTKRDASEKVAKLRRLASDPRTPKTEADTARASADKIAAQHGLREEDLATGRMCAAFDDLVTALEAAVKRVPQVPTGFRAVDEAIRAAVTKVKAMPETDKVMRLRQVVMTVRTAAFVMGGHPLVAEAEAIVNTTLKNHDVQV